MDEARVYEKPAVERLGTLRELTRSGAFGVGDGSTICGAPCECGIMARS
jgi:hypothetical protein